MHADGISYDKAAKLFNVHRITIAEVVRRETWKHI
jgi:transposase